MDWSYSYPLRVDCDTKECIWFEKDLTCSHPCPYISNKECQDYITQEELAKYFNKNGGLING